MTGFKKFIPLVGGTFFFLVLIIGIFFGRDIFEIATVLHGDRKKVVAAQEYMDSLTDKDIQAWIQRTQKYLKEDHPTDFTAKDAPPDLQQLGMTGIEEDSNRVVYVWLGGMGDTALVVERMTNETFQVTAIYAPNSNRIIWPRQ